MSETALPCPQQTELLTVMLVDDHAISRGGVRAMLDGTEFQIVAEAASGAEALLLADQTQPRLVLLDIRMGSMDGLETLQHLKRAHPRMAVVMLTTYENPTFMARAIAGGAAGYLLKGVTRADLLNTLRTVAQGETLLSTHDLCHTLRAISDRIQQADELPKPLTDRELEVLRLLATGLKNHEIAAVLFISDSTVKSHIEHILNKIGVSDRVQAAVWAARHSLLEIAPDAS